MSRRAFRVSASIMVVVALVGFLAPTVCAATPSAATQDISPFRPDSPLPGLGDTPEEAEDMSAFLDCFARTLYENRNMGATYDLTRYIKGDALEAYLAEKVAVHQLVTKRAFLDKQNYEVETSIKEVEPIDDGTDFVSLAVRVSFNYVHMKDIRSSSRELLDLIVSHDDEGFRVLDAYVQFDYYDMEVRGDGIDLKAEYEMKRGLQFSEKSLVMDRVRSMKEGLGSYYDEIDRKLDEGQTVVIFPDSTAGTLNKGAITSYARNYCTSGSPPSGGASVPYYDFSQIPGNWDCTNFVSHTLLAGGATPYNNDEPSTGWYYVDLNHRSYSWSDVGWLYSYLTRSSSTPGPYGVSFAYLPFDERKGFPYSNGDILQHMNTDSIWMHSTVITGVYPYSPSYPYYLGAIVCGRVSADYGQLEYKAEDIYPGCDKRVIRLDGNR